MKRTLAILIALALLSFLSPRACPAGEIGFVEAFALAKDRTVPLKQLIPGTEDHYYYHCLHYQSAARLEKVEDLLKPWIKQHGRTARVVEIENRQALLMYEKDPAASLAYLTRRLGLHFNHQKDAARQRLRLPTGLDQALISRETLTRRALADHPKTLDGFEDSALDWLIDTRLDADHARALLGRLRRPDHAALPALIVADLNQRNSGGFGSHEIHRGLLLAQLDELLKLKGDLLNQTNFVNTYLARLRPGPETDIEHDPAVRRAYLDRLWEFVSRLAPVHNSLKAHVLYHRLVFDRSQAVHDKARFMAYVRLPRSMSYVNPEYLRREDSRRYMVNLTSDFRGETLLWPVRNDEPLIRAYLHHFFLTEDDYKPYAEYLSDQYLKANFAEARLLAGVGDARQWQSMLAPAALAALTDRVDLDFAPTNKTIFAPGDPVELNVDVKNVKKLFVKVYEINTMNYYRSRGREVDTDIDLDGLVANSESVVTFEDVPPIRRVRRAFPFPSLKGRGVYVVEFIGGGISSRALIRKGHLRFLTRTSTAGHVFTVLDEALAKVPDATIWLAGHEYVADEDGTITVPFSTSPGGQPIILARGGLACLDRFDHQAESYSLSAGIHVDREELLKGRTAKVLVKPALLLNGTPVTLSVLRNVALEITSRDRDGVRTTTRIKDFKVHEDRESEHVFRVPAEVVQLMFTLRAEVRNITRNRDDNLVDQKSFPLNGIDRESKVEDLHLGRVDGEYVLSLLGRSGEPRGGRAVNLELKHRDFKPTVTVSLQTDDAGRIALGPLTDIAWVSAAGPDGTLHRWRPAEDACTYPQAVHGRAGEALTVPYLGKAGKATRAELSLLEVRGGSFVADRFDALRIRDGFIEVLDLPAGDYDLLIKPQDRRMTLRLTEGPKVEGAVVSKARMLEVRNQRPLQIAAVEAGAEDVKIRLRNATRFARVHVAATRFLPAYSMYSDLWTRLPGVYAVALPQAESKYLAGRDIGDEYRYILDRKSARTFPGNMLTRPGLLLNPWALRKTEADTQVAREGETWEAAGVAGPRASFMGYGGRPREDLARVGFANLDFLPAGSVVLANLRPDADGVVTVARKDLGDGQQIHVLAVDPEGMVYREVSLKETPLKPLDLRLGDREALDPARHFTERKLITAVAKGGKFTLEGAASPMEAYDSIAKVYTLYTTLSNDPALREFAFILDWPSLSDAQKREKYSKHACHELSFFLSRKDPAFFEKVVRPYLANKKDKTFMDHYLLGEDLSGYLLPWPYGRLNVVERALLGQRLAAERAAAARHVKDLADLLPPDIERANHLFRTALAGSSLAAAPALQPGQPGKAGGLYPALAMTRPAGAAPARPGPAPAPAPPALKEAAKAADEAEALDSAEDRPQRDQAKKLKEMQQRLEGAEKDDAAGRYFEADAKRRADVRRLYVRLDKTEEWAENNYYHLPIERQDASLITAGAFWADYAAWLGKTAFISTRLAEASRSFPEMMLALAVLDLPFTPGKHAEAREGARYTIDAAGEMVVFHKEIRPAAAIAADAPQVLVGQNFFRADDRYRHVDNQRLDKFVTEEFLPHVVYGCQVVVTNPTSSPQKLDVLLQVPRGAVPVAGGKYTRSVHVDLQPYHTQTFDYHFYFPAPGKFPHYPVHVARDERLIAFAAPVTLNVVVELTRVDKTSWEYLSQNGSDEQVLEFLKDNNIGRINLERIAWRMADRAFFEKVLALLERRHAYNDTLWSYALKHNVLPAARQYLQHKDGFLARCGAYIDCGLVTIDPVVRRSYQHLEYSPLVNARAHQLGKTRRILNDRFAAQYHRLMKVLACRAALDDADLMAVTYYLLLQDRVEEAMGFFARVDPARLPARLQHDYFRAYLAFYREQPAEAAKIAAAYGDHPVDRWRKLFANVAAQADEIAGAAAKVADDADRTQEQTRLAATAASLDLKVEARKIALDYQNLAAATVNYYLMDIELLFSRSPFVQEYSDQFSHIRPNLSETVRLDPRKAAHTLDLPKQFHSSNVMVEVVAGGVKKSQAYFSSDLAVQVIDTYGQVRVTHQTAGKPLPKVYVKVYARTAGGQVRFYKDGYTDLRGRFDYSSLNTNELDNVEKFSILVLSEADGAVVREAAPPKQ